VYVPPHLTFKNPSILPSAYTCFMYLRKNSDLPVKHETVGISHTSGNTMWRKAGNDCLPGRCCLQANAEMLPNTQVSAACFSYSPHDLYLSN